MNGLDELEDVRALQILLQGIKTLAEKGLGERIASRGEIQSFARDAITRGNPNTSGVRAFSRM
jgi:hypothetical protein